MEDMVRAEEGRSQLCHSADIPRPCTANPAEPAEFEAIPLSSPPPPSSSSSSATASAPRILLQDYQMQLMLLEQQSKRRLMLARQELDPISRAEGDLPMPSQLSTQVQFLSQCRRSSSASSQSASSSIPPPRYEEELDSNIDVVDGFMYLPTFGREYMHSHASEGGDADDISPDSSVVDCSPRMSFDTGRTTFSSTAK